MRHEGEPPVLTLVFVLVARILISHPGSSAPIPWNEVAVIRENVHKAGTKSDVALPNATSGIANFGVLMTNGRKAP